MTTGERTRLVVGVDTGGTFTDAVVWDGREFHVAKALSTPDNPARAVLEVLARLGVALGGPADERDRDLVRARGGDSPRAGSDDPADDREGRGRGASARDRAWSGGPNVAEAGDGGPDAAEAEDGGIRVIHGSTVATNALLERKGAVTALVTNQGFTDVIEIGRQARPRLYDLHCRRPEPLVPRHLRFGAPGRVDARGRRVEPLTEAEARDIAARVARSGAASVAVCLLFSFLDPRHERLLERELLAAGLRVSASHRVLAEFREYERTATTVVNAYVAPVMSRYLEVLERELGGRARLRVMQSNGGVIRASTAMAEPVRTILSGPAGGLTGAFELARAAGFSRLATFDMGGTSTDVALCDGAPGLTYEAEVGGLPVRTPMCDIHTVGAGGGSIVAADAGGALTVGPESAGADPGPVVYGRGQALTVTDANVFLGRIDPERFLGGAMRLYPERLPERFAALGRRLGLSPPEAAEGVLAVAEATMERAIRVISVARGHDPADFTLVSFGGAGGLHAVALARALGIRTVLIPRFPGLLSALGMVMAEVVKDYSATVMLPHGPDTAADLAARFGPMEDAARRDLAREGLAGDRMAFTRLADLRYRGQSFELSTPLGPDLAGAFHALHHKTYGYARPDRPIEVVNIRLRATGRTDRPALPRLSARPGRTARDAAVGRTRTRFAGREHEAAIMERERFFPGAAFDGPAVVVETSATTFVPPGCAVRVDEYGNLILRP